MSVETRSTLSSGECSGRDIPSFIEPQPPTVAYPWLRPKPVTKTNLLELFEEEATAESIISDDTEVCDDTVRVFLRIKPCPDPSPAYKIKSHQTLELTLQGDPRSTHCPTGKLFKFARIFQEDATQQQVFNVTVKEELDHLRLGGKGFTLLMYGASGSGKTHTLLGSVKEPGIVPRSLEYLFRNLPAADTPRYRPVQDQTTQLDANQQKQELQWVAELRRLCGNVRSRYRRASLQCLADADMTSTLPQSDALASTATHYIWVSFVEVYNEAVYDLLSFEQPRKKLRICEDSSGNAYVKGAREAFVRSGLEAYEVMLAGKHNLQVAATGVHGASSRSHCVFSIAVLSEGVAHGGQGGQGAVGVRRVRLCDLAGAERAARTHNAGARMQESRAINTSLHVLERCLTALRNGTMPPYRDSKLTRLVGGAVRGGGGGAERLSLLVTLNPAPTFLSESRHVLNLCAIAKNIYLNNTVDYTASSDASALHHETEIMTLKAENERLRFEMEMRNNEIERLQQEVVRQRQEGARAASELVAESNAHAQHYCEQQLQLQRDQHRHEMEALRLQFEFANQSDSQDEQIKKLRLELEKERSSRMALEQQLACLKELQEMFSKSKEAIEESIENMSEAGSPNDDEDSESDQPLDIDVSCHDSSKLAEIENKIRYSIPKYDHSDNELTDYEDDDAPKEILTCIKKLDLNPNEEDSSYKIGMVDTSCKSNTGNTVVDLKLRSDNYKRNISKDNKEVEIPIDTSSSKRVIDIKSRNSSIVIGDHEHENTSQGLKETADHLENIPEPLMNASTDDEQSRKNKLREEKVNGTQASTEDSHKDSYSSKAHDHNSLNKNISRMLKRFELHNHSSKASVNVSANNGGESVYTDISQQDPTLDQWFQGFDKLRSSELSKPSLERDIELSLKQSNQKLDDVKSDNSFSRHSPPILNDRHNDGNKHVKCPISDNFSIASPLCKNKFNKKYESLDMFDSPARNVDDGENKISENHTETHSSKESHSDGRAIVLNNNMKTDNVVIVSGNKTVQNRVDNNDERHEIEYNSKETHLTDRTLIDSVKRADENPIKQSELKNDSCQKDTIDEQINKILKHSNGDMSQTKRAAAKQDDANERSKTRAAKDRKFQVNDIVGDLAKVKIEPVSEDEADSESGSSEVFSKHSTVKKLRRKPLDKGNKENVPVEGDTKEIEDVQEKKPRRNLRLKAKPNQKEETEGEADRRAELSKLRAQFGDVTEGGAPPPAPAPRAPSPPSPPAPAPDRDLAYSCPNPNKSTRSRRKLFTPRADILDEEFCGDGGAAGAGGSEERLRVPRPSYHRAKHARARRKL